MEGNSDSGPASSLLEWEKFYLFISAELPLPLTGVERGAERSKLIERNI